MNSTTTHPTDDVSAAPDLERPSTSRPSRWLVGAATALAVIVVAGFVAVVLIDDDAVEGQTADIRAQGDRVTSLHDDAARLIRRDDGLVVEIDMPTPPPGSYQYPTADLVPPWADAHPPVSPGASGAPEAFTVWLAVFNHPEECTDDQCDFDDLGPDAPGGGGNYQIDGRIGSDDRLLMIGSVRLGEASFDGSRLVNPVGAEVHLAVAPHGRALPGSDGWRQLNGPVGTPDHWWSATFLP